MWTEFTSRTPKQQASRIVLLLLLSVVNPSFAFGRMNCKIFSVFVITALAFLTIVEGMSLRGVGVELRCRCIETESRRIGKYVESVELFPPSPHCKDTEIIATLKGTKQEICLDPTAPWVKKVIEKILANKAL